MIDSIPALAEKLSFFADLTQAERLDLVKASHVRSIKKGEFLFYHGDEAHGFFIVADGAVRLHRQTPDGKDITLHIAIVGDTLGDQEIFDRRSGYQASAIAVEDSVVLHYPSEWIVQKIREHSELALNMLAVMSKSSGRLHVDREHLVTLKAPQRVGCFLMRLCDLHHLNPGDFTLPYSKSTIASKLGMEPETFSRALAKLKDVGVGVQNMQVNISNVDALNEYVCNACSVAEDCETCEHMQDSVRFGKIGG